MIININPKWRINTDRYQFILQEKTTPKDKSKEGRWRSRKYDPSLAVILTIMYHMQVWDLKGEYPPEALEALVDSLEDIREEIKKVVAVMARDSNSPG